MLQKSKIIEPFTNHGVSVDDIAHVSGLLDWIFWASLLSSIRYSFCIFSNEQVYFLKIRLYFN